MTTLTHDFPGIPLGTRISTAAASLLESIVKHSDGARCAAYAARLDALSDDELAARGIRRADIVRVAFARHMRY